MTKETNNCDGKCAPDECVCPEVNEWEKEFEAICVEENVWHVDPDDKTEWNVSNNLDFMEKVGKLIISVLNQTLEEAAEALEKERFHIYSKPKDSRERGLNIINSATNSAINSSQTIIRALKK